MSLDSVFKNEREKIEKKNFPHYCAVSAWSIHSHEVWKSSWSENIALGVDIQYTSTPTTYQLLFNSLLSLNIFVYSVMLCVAREELAVMPN